MESIVFKIPELRHREAKRKRTYIEEKYEKLEAKIKLLKAENELLKKIEMQKGE